MALSKRNLIEQKIVAANNLKFICAGWRVNSQKIVFTNGCFDILHRGHIEVLMQAAAQGHRLIVGVNTDASVKRLKGSSRPINQEYNRCLLLAALTVVDAVCLFDEDTPLELIKLVLPDVLVKGGDYTEATIVGATEVKNNGGNIVIVPTLDNYSTTNIIAQLSQDKA